MSISLCILSGQVVALHILFSYPILNPKTPLSPVRIDVYTQANRVETIRDTLTLLACTLSLEAVLAYRVRWSVN